MGKDKTRLANIEMISLSFLSQACSGVCSASFCLQYPELTMRALAGYHRFAFTLKTKEFFGHFVTT